MFARLVGPFFVCITGPTEGIYTLYISTAPLMRYMDKYWRIDALLEYK